MSFNFSHIKKLSGARGFTLVEVMIAMAIFTIIVTIGIGSVLDAITQHQVTENTRTVMDSLNYVMEDMDRNIRNGTPPRCGADPLVDPMTGVMEPLSCPLTTDAHNKISINAQDGTVLTYVITAPTPGSPSEIIKQKGTDAPEVITPPEVQIDFASSGFTVRGAEAGDGTQPTVVIRLAGTIKYKNTNAKFAIETTATLRGLDS